MSAKRSRTDDPAGSAAAAKKARPDPPGGDAEPSEQQQPSGRKPRAAPRKEKRQEKKARLEREKQDRDQAASISSGRGLKKLFADDGAADEGEGRSAALRIFLQFLILLRSNIQAAPEGELPWRRGVFGEYLEFEKQEYASFNDLSNMDVDENEQAEKNDRKEHFFLAGPVSSWVFSSRRNVEPLFLLSSRTVALATEIISADADLASAYGDPLVHSTLLQPQTLRLLNRGLSAPKYRRSMIVPSLRILTCFVSIGAGSKAGEGSANAQLLYRRKEALCEPKMMAKILSTHRASTELNRNESGKLLDTDSDDEAEADQDDDNHTVRAHGLRYITALIRYGNTELKLDLIRQNMLTRSLFDYLRHDTAEELQAIFRAIRINIILDKTMYRRDKSPLFVEKNMEGILAAVRSGTSTGDEPGNLPGDAAFDFLQFVCASPNAGFVPISNRSGYNAEESSEEDSTFPIPLLSAQDEGTYAMRNPFISITQSTSSLPDSQKIMGFISHLRPHSNPNETALLLNIFRATPALVPFYFDKPAVIAGLEQKPSAAWMGIASFLFQVVQLPLPKISYVVSTCSSEHRPGRSAGLTLTSPPLPELVAAQLAEAILPSPLTSQVLTKCLNSSYDLVPLFTIRILALALEKLHQAVTTLEEAARGPGSSYQYYTAVIELLRERVTPQFPAISAVVAAFRRTNIDNLVEHEAAARLLRLYYSNLTQTSLLVTFDLSVMVAQKLAQFLQSDGSNGSDDSETKEREEEHRLRLLTLEHLVEVARCSPGFQWWNRTGKLKYSPFVSLLQVVVAERSSKAVDVSRFRLALESVVMEYGILADSEDRGSSPSALDTLVFSLDGRSDAHFAVLDECVNRLARKAAKYQDDLDAIISKRKPSDKAARLSPIVAVLVEQWPFVQKAHAEETPALASWITSFLFLLEAVGEDWGCVRVVLEQLKETTEDKSARKLIRRSYKDPAGNREDAIAAIAQVKSALEAEAERKAAPTKAKPSGPTKSELLAEYALADKADAKPTTPLALGALAARRDEYPELTRWKGRDSETALLDDSVIPALIRCLCAPQPEIRKQAFDQLVLFGRVLSRDKAVKQSERVLTLLGETLDTAKPYLDEGKQPPSILASFAVSSLPVVLRPGEALESVARVVNRILSRALREGKGSNKKVEDDDDDDENENESEEGSKSVWPLDRLPGQLVHFLFLDPPVAQTVTQMVHTQQQQQRSAGSRRAWKDHSAGPSKFVKQTVWLLDLFLAAVQTPADVALFDSAGGGSLLERVLALYSSPFATDDTRNRILGLVYRIASISASADGKLTGGAQVLVTRYGALEWLETVSASCPGGEVDQIRSKIVDMCREKRKDGKKDRKKKDAAEGVPLAGGDRSKRWLVGLA